MYLMRTTKWNGGHFLVIEMAQAKNLKAQVKSGNFLVARVRSSRVSLLQVYPFQEIFLQKCQIFPLLLSGQKNIFRSGQIMCGLALYLLNLNLCLLNF